MTGVELRCWYPFVWSVDDRHDINEGVIAKLPTKASFEILAYYNQYHTSKENQN